MNKLVSIITPCYNSGRFIEETIKSVQNQTYSNWEMLITDDGSSDNSIEIIEKLQAKDSRIKIFKIQNSGAAVARNNSIKLANGQYLAFLDSDDLWTSEKLEKQIHFMNINKYSLSFGSYQKITEEGKLIEKSITPTLHKVSYKDMMTSNKMGCLTVMYDTHLLGKVFMPIIRKRQDYALWLKLLKLTPYAYCLQEKLGYYRIRKSSISASKIEMLKWNWKLFRDIEKLSFLNSVHSVLMNIMYKVFK
jgi:glycosyltransferase involved in cell wall biosynthesis